MIKQLEQFGDSGPLGKKVIYFSAKLSPGFSYWQHNPFPGENPWRFADVQRMRHARRIRPATAKRYIPRIP